MPNFSSKKLTFCDHFDYSALVANHHRNNFAGFKQELKTHFSKTMKNNANIQKVINSLTNLWFDFSGGLGHAKKDVVAAFFYYGDKYSDFHPFERFNCLCVLTFKNYLEVLKIIAGFGYYSFTKDELKTRYTQRGGTRLSDATITDQINQILGTMTDIGVVKRNNGLYKLQQRPVFDVVSIYIILRTYEALSEMGDASWFLKCFNFEIDKEFVSFFKQFNYSLMVDENVYKQFVENQNGTMRLSMGKWHFAEDEMVFSNGIKKSQVDPYLYVTVKEIIKGSEKETFDGVWEEAYS